LNTVSCDLCVISISKEIVATTEDMVRSKTTKELYKMQAEIAMFMEIGYLSASNFPELAGEVILILILIRFSDMIISNYLNVPYKQVYTYVFVCQ